MSNQTKAVIINCNANYKCKIVSLYIFMITKKKIYDF